MNDRVDSLRLRPAGRRRGVVRDTCITLSHGSGGKAMRDLIDDVFVAAFDNRMLSTLEDQARLVELGPADVADSLTEARPIDLAADQGSPPLEAIAETESTPSPGEEAVIAENLLETGVIDFAGAPLEGDDGDEPAVERDADVIQLRAAPISADAE